MRSSSAGAPIAVTMGEPSGIGTEITLKAWRVLREEDYAFFLLHDPDHVREAAGHLSLDVPVVAVANAQEARRAFADALPVLPASLNAPVRFGFPDAANAPVVEEAIRASVRLAAAGEVAAVVTNPIQKSALYAAGFGFPGHTEFLEHLAGSGFRATMMLASNQLRVVPVSIHESLATAVSGISLERIVETAKAAHAGLRRDFGLERPRLAIAGLNPHAGEGGSMGREEIEIIVPAIERLRQAGVDVAGPYPPDTMFTPRARRGYDVAVCMYHDQALIPLKTIDVDGGVNVTLGLPFVRTSPDHGTALDVAGKGLADPGSLVSAIRMAAGIVRHRKSTGD